MMVLYIGKHDQVYELYLLYSLLRINKSYDFFMINYRKYSL